MMVPVTLKPTKVSGSEALAIGSCERKHMYAFHPEYNLEANYQGDAITRGLIGHAGLEVYYTDIMNGKSLQEAKTSLKKFISGELVKATLDDDMRIVEIVTKLMGLLLEYVDSKHNLDFLDSVTIIGVEYGVSVELPGNLILPGKLDLLVKYRKGPWNGEIAGVDHKFVYNFWGENALRMNAQMPNYTFALREMYKAEGKTAVIKRGVINQIRHRDNAVDKFKFDEIVTPKKEVVALIENHIKLATRAAYNKALPVEVVRDEAARTLSKYSCENCSFLALCKMEMTGGDIPGLIAMKYRPNSYGYDKNDEETV